MTPEQQTLLRTLTLWALDVASPDHACKISAAYEAARPDRAELSEDQKSLRLFALSQARLEEEITRLRAELERARAAALDEAAAIATGWLDAFVQEPIEFIDASTFASDAVRDIRDGILARKRAAVARAVTEAGIEAAARKPPGPDWLVKKTREALNDRSMFNRMFLSLCGGPAALPANQAEMILESARAILQAGGG